MVSFPPIFPLKKKREYQKGEGLTKYRLGQNKQPTKYIKLHDDGTTFKSLVFGYRYM